MKRLIVAMILLMALAGCVGDPVSAEAIEAVAKTCEENGQQVYVKQTAGYITIKCR